MASKVMFVCDICDAPIDGDGGRNIRVGFADWFGEVDLCEADRAALEESLRPVLKASRRPAARVARLAPQRRGGARSERSPVDYVCAICGGQFSGNRAMSQHVRTHGGRGWPEGTELPFACSCGLAWMTPASLENHLRKNSDHTRAPAGL